MSGGRNTPQLQPQY